jgi:hypothetical protein
MAEVYGDVAISTLGKLAMIYEGTGGANEVTDNLGYDGTVAVGDFASATQFEFLSESISKQEPMQYNGGIRGTRSRNCERVRKAATIVQGSIEMTPTPLELDKLLYWVTGTASTPFALTELVPTIAIIVDRSAQRFMYPGCKIGQFSIGGQQGGLIRTQLGIIGKQEFVTASAFPTLTIDNKEPYVFSEAVFAYGGDTYEINSFEITIDHGIDTSRQMNSLYRRRLPAGDRSVQLQLGFPYSVNVFEDFNNLAEEGIDGATLTVTNGTVSFTATFGNLKADNQTPVNGGRGSEIMMPVQFTAYKKSSTMEVSFANDSTP